MRREISWCDWPGCGKKIGEVSGRFHKHNIRVPTAYNRAGPGKTESRETSFDLCAKHKIKLLREALDQLGTHSDRVDFLEQWFDASQIKSKDMS